MLLETFICLVIYSFHEIHIIFYLGTLFQNQYSVIKELQSNHMHVLPTYIALPTYKTIIPIQIIKFAQFFKKTVRFS